MPNLLGREPFLGADILVHAFENSADAVQIDDIDGAVYYVNAAWTALFGNTPDLPSGITREHLSYADADTKLLEQSWVTCLESGFARDSIVINPSSHLLMNTLDVSRTLYKSSEGDPLAMLTVYRNISGEELRQYVSEFLTQVVPRDEGSIAFLEPTPVTLSQQT